MSTSTERRLYNYVDRTQVESYPSLTTAPGYETYIASEAHQPGGSFKVRGAIAYMLETSHENVVTASAGSFAAGIGYAAQSLGKGAEVFVPVTTPERKLALVRSFGATVIVAGENYPEALHKALKHSAAHDIPYVSPFDDAAVIAGAKTLGDEILARTPRRPRTVYVPIGGGGLMAGMLLAASEHDDARVVGVQYATHTSAEASLRAGTLREASGALDTTCEGSAVRRIGVLPFALMQRHRDCLEGFVTVTPAEVGERLWEEMVLRHKLVPPYGEALAFDGMPETTALVAEAGMKKWIATRRASEGSHIAVRTGGNTDATRETALLDAYKDSLSTDQPYRQKIFLGAHVA